MKLAELIPAKLPLVDEHKTDRNWFIGLMDFAWISGRDGARAEAAFEVEIHQAYPGKFEVVLRQDQPCAGDRNIFYGNASIAGELLNMTRKVISAELGVPVFLRWGADLIQNDDRFVLILDEKDQSA